MKKVDTINAVIKNVLHQHILRITNLAGDYVDFNIIINHQQILNQVAFIIYNAPIITANVIIASPLQADRDHGNLHDYECVIYTSLIGVAINVVMAMIIKMIVMLIYTHICVYCVFVFVCCIIVMIIVTISMIIVIVIVTRINIVVFN